MHDIQREVQEAEIRDSRRTRQISGGSVLLPFTNAFTNNRGWDDGGGAAITTDILKGVRKSVRKGVRNVFVSRPKSLNH